MINKKNILITGIGGAGVGRQIIKALQLSTLPLRLFGSDSNNDTFGLEDVEKFIRLPLANDKNYIPTLLNFCLENKIEALFPGSEPELLIISKNIKIFKQKKIYVPINPYSLISKCLDKFECYNFLMEGGFNCPTSYLIRNIEDTKKINFFPMVLKPCTGSGGSSNVLIVQNKEELNMFTHYLLINGINIIAQHYIGNPENEYTVGVLSTPEGTIINSITLKRFLNYGIGYKEGIKNRTPYKELGEKLIISSGISQGEFIEKSFINETCEHISLLLGSTSAINIQGRIHNNKFYVFEINPRFSGTTSARALMGYNEPEILLKNYLFKEPIDFNFKYKRGKVYRGLLERIIK